MIIPSQDLQRELTDIGFASEIVFDRDLFCPSSAWLDEFTGYLQDHKRPSAGEAWDCDDYAMWSRSLASEANAASGRTCGHAFLFATIGLYDHHLGIAAEMPTGHALNLVRTSDMGWLFYEPQTGLWSEARRSIDSGAVAPRRALL